jgi:hypothetical protein
MTYVVVRTPLGLDKANTPYDWKMTSKSVVGPVTGTGQTDSRGVARFRVEFRAPEAGTARVTIYALDDQGQYGPLAKTRMAWECRLVPKITSTSPGSGPTAGGTRVTVFGRRVGSKLRVTFDGQVVSPVRRLSAKRIRFTMPAHAAGPVDLRIWSPGGRTPFARSWRVPADRITYE